MDNLAYIALQGLDEPLQRELEAGQAPIGHLLARLWVRREAVPGAGVLHDRLWNAVGTPDPAATRAYRIVTPEGPRMLIAETYRRGMLMDRS
jgi:chorismate-pyruvate lyase